MLVHHFGSRDALIAAALAHARSQLLETCRAQLAEQNPQDLRGLVSALRAIVTDPVNRPFFRLFDEVNALARPVSGFRPCQRPRLAPPIH
jgi:AcrR family transcriptional regulator